MEISRIFVYFDSLYGHAEIRCNSGCQVIVKYLYALTHQPLIQACNWDYVNPINAK